MLSARAGIEKILSTEGVLGLGLALRDGALRPSFGLTALGECHAVGCATQRLARPEVRRAFLDFASNCLEERLSTLMPCDGLQASVLALGCGFLLFELELLETLRRCHGIVPSIVRLVDPLYRPANCSATRRRQHAFALEAVEEFKTWFEDTSVVTYGSVAELKDEQDLLALPLVVDVVPFLSRLSSWGLFLRLCGCEGHGEDGDLFRRLLKASADGEAIWRSTSADALQRKNFPAPELPELRRRYLERFVHVSPESRAGRLFRVTADGVPKGVVVIRDAPRLDGRLIGCKHRGDLVVANHEDRSMLEGKRDLPQAWMLRAGEALGFGMLLQELDLKAGGLVFLCVSGSATPEFTKASLVRAWGFVHQSNHIAAEFLRHKVMAVTQKCAEMCFLIVPCRFRPYLLKRNLWSPDVALLNVALGFEPTLTVALCHLAIAQRRTRPERWTPLSCQGIFFSERRPSL
eukprot:s1406_g14.t1